MTYDIKADVTNRGTAHVKCGVKYFFRLVPVLWRNMPPSSGCESGLM